jgi:drug/metabolite transporter (DMT)-like permease
LLWIPVTVLAALAQTFRNAAQRNLIDSLGTWGATLIRFLFGLPFALLWLAFLSGRSETPNLLPLVLAPSYGGWLLMGAVMQIIATAFLLRSISKNNFALGIALSKSEIIQVAIFAILFLGETLSPKMVLAILLTFMGVVLVSLPRNFQGFSWRFSGLRDLPTLLGLAAGSGFALSAVGYRGAAVELAALPPFLSAACSLVVAQAAQTLLLGGWLLVKSPKTVGAVLAAWKPSLLAGFLGALASALWFSAFAMEPVSHVRTLGMVELLFGLLVSARFFKERLEGRELSGYAILCLGLIAVVWPV